jgi:hypothetical protein
VRTVRSRAAALIVASAAVLLVAACGGDRSDSPGGGRSGTAFTAYRDCLAKNGVTIAMPSRGPRAGASGAGFPQGGRPSGMPRPSGSRFPGGGFPGAFRKPTDVDDATWQRAQEACASVRPSFGAGSRGGNGRDTAFRNCLQDHGVTATGGDLDPNDATVKKALAICRVLRQPQASAGPTA